MQLNSVSKITESVDAGLLIVDCEIIDLDGEPLQVKYAYRESDPYGVNPLIKAWIAAHPQFPIDPYVPPTPPTAQELREQMPHLTARQFRLGLVMGGKSPSQVDAAIAAMPEGPDKETAKIEWEYATTFRRTHPLVVSLGVALGLSAAAIDSMWSGAINL